MTLAFTIPGLPVPKGRPRFASVAGHVRAFTPKPTMTHENWIRECALDAMQRHREAAGATIAGSDCPMDRPDAAIRQRKRLISGAGAQSAADPFPLDGPLAIRVRFYLPRPPSRRKAELWPDRKPDLDNLLKALWDGLSLARVFVGDSRIVRVEAEKLYGEAKTEVQVAQVEGEMATLLDAMEGR